MSIPVVRGAAVLSALALAAPGMAAGAGFALTEFSVKTLGSALSGTTAGALDAATVYWNPAGMTALPGTRLQAGGVYITVDAQFRNQGSTLSTAGEGGVASVPDPGFEADGGEDALAPHLFLVTELGDDLTLGLGVHTPFGLQSDYPAGWVGRYHALESSLRSVDINPSLAWRLDERWSVGAGVSLQYADATLGRAVFTGGPDGLAEVTGDDWGYGFNLGVIFQADPDTRLGLAYRSAVEHRMEGELRVSGTGAFDGITGSEAKLTFPEHLAFGFHRRLGSRWALMGDATWTRWSRFDELRVHFDDGRPDEVTVHDWEDTWRLALGVSYTPSPAWTLRAGVAYDQSPIPGPERRTPRIPGNDRRWLGLGLSYRPSERLTLDLGFARLFLHGAAVSNTVDLMPTAPGSVTHTLVGRFDTGSDAFGAEVTYRF
jgi:long-chain fatty acid transport protein